MKRKRQAFSFSSGKEEDIDLSLDWEKINGILTKPTREFMEPLVEDNEDGKVVTMKAKGESVTKLSNKVTV